jgi:hypothetical protein
MAEFIDYGGVQPLQLFLHSMYDYVKMDRIFIALFDSDEALVKARSELQKYCQDKWGFTDASGTDFVSIRSGFSIEGLFSDTIIRDVHTATEKLFLSYAEDAAAGAVEPFQLRDKIVAFDAFTKRAEMENGFDWAQRFIQVCSALESALTRQKDPLAATL